MPDDHDPTRGPGLYALSRVHRTARTAADRVREAVTRHGAVIAPLRVLVVDVHPDAADALVAVLELLGCPARACYSGLSALAAAGEFDPQVCLLDLTMPGTDGPELAARLKAQAAGRPLFLVGTAAPGEFGSGARTAAAEFHDHLVRPVDVPTLVEALTRLGRVFVAPTADGPSGTG